MSTVGRILGTAGIVTGVLGAAAFGGVTAQRMAVRKYQTAQAALLTEPGADPGFEALPSDRTYSVDSWDGVALHVEEVGPLDAPITVVFAHGWTLRLGSWHYQRLGLASVGFELLERRDLSDRLVLVRVRWLFFDAGGVQLTDTDSYYLLRDEDEEGLQACVCVETDAAQKLQALATERGVDLTAAP